MVSISSTFYERQLRQYFWAKKFQSQNITSEKLRKVLFYKKFELKMLMKSTPGVPLFSLLPRPDKGTPI